MMYQFLLYCLMGFLLAGLIWYISRTLLIRSGWFAGRGPCLRVYKLPERQVRLEQASQS